MIGSPRLAERFKRLFHIALLLLRLVSVSARGVGDQHSLDVFKDENIVVEYKPGAGYVLPVRIGEQDLKLRLMSRINGVVLFQKGTEACGTALAPLNCYDPESSKTAAWCDNKDMCIPGSKDFECKEVTSHASIHAATISEFYCDGRANSMATIEGLERITIRNGGLLTPIIFDHMPIKMANKVSWSPGDETTFGTAGGMFGLAGSSVSCRDRCLWTQLLQRYDGCYALDFNGYDGLLGRREPSGSATSPAASRIHMGWEFAKTHEVMWAEKRQVGGMFTDAYMGFSVYDMSMCGVNLFGKTSSYWQAEIDVSSRCLVLPKNFWLSVMSQLPIMDDCYTSDTGGGICKLRRENVAKLPTLEFALKQQGSDQVLRIPLENLLLDDSQTPEICIVPDETATSISTFANNPTIKFGYKVLESLSVVVDTRGHRVGFVHKTQVATGNDICAKSAECIGDQVYIPELNFCMQPFCSIWIFKRLDEATGRCVTSPIVIALLCVVLTGLLLMEGRRYFARQRLFDVARRLS